MFVVGKLITVNGDIFSLAAIFSPIKCYEAFHVIKFGCNLHLSIYDSPRVKSSTLVVSLPIRQTY